MSEIYGENMGISCAKCELLGFRRKKRSFTKSLHNLHALPIAIPPPECYTVAKSRQEGGIDMVWSVHDNAADLDDLIFDEDRPVPSER